MGAHHLGQMQEQPAAAAPPEQNANGKATTMESLLRYGVVHLRGCFTEQEQHALYRQIQPCIKGGNFLVSVGPPGGENWRGELHQLGDALYARIVAQLSQLSGRIRYIVQTP